jgi:hypothetical protein
MIAARATAERINYSMSYLLAFEWARRASKKISTRENISLIKVASTMTRRASYMSLVVAC